MRTQVDGERFLFATDIDQDGFRTTIVVHWTATRHGMQPTVNKVRLFANQRIETKEVWFVYPSDLTEQHESMRKLDEWDYRAPVGEGLNVRFFAVNTTGGWDEIPTEWSSQGGDPVDVSLEVQSRVIADGLRQIFLETDALETASAGYHFARSRSGRHSKKFLRASQTVARSQHAYFVAMAVFRVAKITSTSRLFVDTAGIAPAMFALKDLHRRLCDEGEQITVESFGSYERFEVDLTIRDDGDLVVISSSTSGSLAEQIAKVRNINPVRIVTLFYLAADPLPEERGAVICDLTNRDPTPLDSVRDARLLPYPTYPKPGEKTCELCVQGNRTIELAGDGFFPLQDGLQLRMPVLSDRLYERKSGREERDTARKFDDSNYFTDFFGLDAIRAGRTILRSGTPLETTTTIGHLLRDETESEHIREHLRSKVEDLRRNHPSVSAVISILDSDSRALAQFVAQEIIPSAIALKSISAFVSPDIVTHDVNTLPDLLPRLAPNSSVIVCAGVVGSGRTLLALSRDLRVLRNDILPLYLVGVTHPESDALERIFEGTIARRSADGLTYFEKGWRLPREPRSPGSLDPWGEESALLDEITKRLPKKHDMALNIAIVARGKQLIKLRSNQLFVSSSFSGPNEHPMPHINPKFALWPEDWQQYKPYVDRKIAPSQAEVLATVAHFLHQSRRYSTQIDKSGANVRRHGYALNPAIFDRFNDPQIQAAILRSVEPGELDYSADTDASRAIADIIDYVWRNIGNEGGESAYEFVLSMARGKSKRTNSGLRLTDDSLRVILSRAGAKKNFEDANPLTRAALLFLRSHVRGRLP